jgi:hypothetical protein
MEAMISFRFFGRGIDVISRDSKSESKGIVTPFVPSTAFYLGG